MLRIGLTGGIGCGKSAVAAMMRELGCHIIEADKIAHRVIEPGQPAYEEVVREFGPEILAADSRAGAAVPPKIDRARLASIVFADPARLAKLNSIVHPRVLAEEDRELQRLERAHPEGIAVIEAALLVEAGFHKRLDRLVVVWCAPEQQIERLTGASSGRAMTQEQARRRIASQMSMAEKRKLADDELDNSGSVEHTRQQVAALVARLKRLAATQPRAG